MRVTTVLKDWEGFSESFLRARSIKVNDKDQFFKSCIPLQTRMWLQSLFASLPYQGLYVSHDDRGIALNQEGKTCKFHFINLAGVGRME